MLYRIEIYDVARRRADGRNIVAAGYLPAPQPQSMLAGTSIQRVQLCLTSRATHFALLLGPHMDSISKDKDN